jgi:guanylate kinase
MTSGKRGIFVVIIGPSAVGKTTLVDALLKSVPGSARLITNTTRAPRPGEIDGRDYFFLTREEFARRRDEGEFFEWAETHANFYGSSRSVLERMLAEHPVVLAILDVKGAKVALGGLESCLTVFVAPGSFGEIERRILARPGSTIEDAERRLRTAREELAQASDFHHQVTNCEGLFEDTVAEVRGIIERETARELSR